MARSGLGQWGMSLWYSLQFAEDFEVTRRQRWREQIRRIWSSQLFREVDSEHVYMYVYIYIIYIHSLNWFSRAETSSVVIDCCNVNYGNYFGLTQLWVDQQHALSRITPNSEDVELIDVPLKGRNMWQGAVVAMLLHALALVVSVFGAMSFYCAYLLTGVPGGVQGPDRAVYFIPRTSHFVVRSEHAVYALQNLYLLDIFGRMAISLCGRSWCVCWYHMKADSNDVFWSLMMFHELCLPTSSQVGPSTFCESLQMEPLSNQWVVKPW